jgi:hypothetical protein
MLLQTAQKSGTRLDGEFGAGEFGALAEPLTASANSVSAREAMLALPM